MCFKMNSHVSTVDSVGLKSELSPAEAKKPLIPGPRVLGTVGEQVN